jgi:hypothetical protein
VGWRHAFDQRYEAVTARIPPTIAGSLDLLRPSYRSPWGGPLNDQARRQELVQELASAVRFDHVIETGSHRGTTTDFLAATFRVRIDTVERSPRLYAYCRWRFALRSQVRVAHDDSRRFLAELGRQSSATDETTFIYLDAHSGPDVPLVEELHIVAMSWRRAIVMIDDFEVPGDPGYCFHDYGPGTVLTESLLPMTALRGWTVWYPRTASAQETGECRGCVVLASPALAHQVSDVAGLRPGGVS